MTVSQNTCLKKSKRLRTICLYNTFSASESVLQIRPPWA